MKEVFERIEELRADTERHPFFTALESLEDLGAIKSVIPVLTFWVMTFQDVLKMNRDLATESPYVEILQQHYEEDCGHDKWFLQDLRKVSGQLPRVDEVFGPEHESIRFMSYRISALCMALKSDAERIALIESLEATAQLFFPRYSAALARVGLVEDFLFFGETHLLAEESHEIGDEEMKEQLTLIELDETSRAACITLAGECFSAFDLLWNEMHEALKQPADLPV
ncbi:hypothetical protein [Streptomyces sp. NPDC053431]|uniref:hypothetical protein n=1 Tax=Streptomyces sp. NPDC053431 TaxID=3365703 RepID=UPI0037D47DC4